jgi:hypothetical protein
MPHKRGGCWSLAMRLASSAATTVLIASPMGSPAKGRSKHRARAAGHSSTKKTGSEAPAKAPRFRMDSGGCDGACHGERGESESGNSGFLTDI